MKRGIVIKKVMMLGGNYFQTTAIKAAKELGHYVISVDYIPDNPGHQFSDEYHNVSTVDKEAVLKLAQELKIDGIVSYASDVSASTAAYVAEKMGLPTNPYESVMILTHKNLFRHFLQKNGFNCPKSKGFGNIEEAFQFYKSLNKPVMIKPSDSSGSKGVYKIENPEEFESAFYSAMEYSLSKTIVVEEFIKRKGYQIAGDGFITDGELTFTGFMDEHYDKNGNPFVPTGPSYPSSLSEDLKSKAKSEINRLMKLLNMKFGAINMDLAFDENDDFYILEIGPRNGGGLITDVIKEASGIDLAALTVQASLGLDYDKEFKETKHSFVSPYNVHTNYSGKYVSTVINEEIKKDIVLFDEFAKKGDIVQPLNNASLNTGIMIIKFRSLDEMLYRMDNMEEYIKVEVE